MTLVQLEYIVAVDTYRSFGAAAEKCFVTQPTLSMQIQKLEETMGVKLFDRSRQPVIPTDIGREVIEQARRVLAESAKMHEIVSEHKNELAGELRIGVIPTVAPYLLPRVITSYTGAYPKVRLLIWEYTTEQIISNLKSGLLDCGILSTPLDDRSLHEMPLFYENFVVYASGRSEVLERKEVTTDDIGKEELWLLNEGHCMRNQVLNICSYKELGENVRLFEYNTGSVETLKRMVDLNEGITVLPELSLSEFSETQLARVRNFRSPVPVREISLVTHRNFLKRAMIRAFSTEILQIIPEHMKSGKKKTVVKHR
jgi:LysR family transcriptional regulator, hydrogen peroxide-inducible genes activator